MERSGSVPAPALSSSLVFSSFFCQLPSEHNRLLQDFSSLLYFAFFLYHSFFGSFPCSLLTPGDIFWPPHISFSLPQLLVFLPYMAVSPDVVTAHFWTFTRFGCNAEWTITLTKYIWRRSLCQVFVLFPPIVIRHCSQYERLLNEHYCNWAIKVLSHVLKSI